MSTIANIVNAENFSLQGDKYLGRKYEEMDCQKFYEQCLADAGWKKDLKGSNAWYREFLKNGWVGSPEECKRIFGSIPKGATLFIHAFDGGEVARGYHDGLGNASHIGIKTGRGKGAINSSYTLQCVAESEFRDKTIKGGGWNIVGLHTQFDYGTAVNKRLAEVTGNNSGGQPEEGAIPMNEEAKVVLPVGASGSTVNLRADASKHAEVITRVPVGSTVRVTEDWGEWCAITYAGKSGYMMSNYLEYTGQEGESGEGNVTVSAGDYEKLGAAIKAIEEAVEIIGSIIGRG